MNRALPGWAVDLIRDGVPKGGLKAGGDRAVYNALFRTAQSACQLGWSEAQWKGEIVDRRSNLGRQAGLRGGKTPLSPKQLYDLLTKAWTRAVESAATNPWQAWSRDEAKEAARARAQGLRNWCSGVGPADRLSERDRAVLLHAADRADHYGSISPVLPHRTVAEALGISQRQARQSLARLTFIGLLQVRDPGRHDRVASKRRSTSYLIPDAEALDAYSVLVNQSVVHPAQVYGPPRGDVVVRPHRSMVHLETSATPLTTVTVTGLDPEKLAVVISALSDAVISGQQHEPEDDRGPAQIFVMPPPQHRHHAGTDGEQEKDVK